MSAALVLPQGVDPVAALHVICRRQKSAVAVLLFLLDRGASNVESPFTEMSSVLGFATSTLKNAVRVLRYQLGYIDATKPGRTSVYDVLVERVQAAINGLLVRRPFSTTGTTNGPVSGPGNSTVSGPGISTGGPVSGTVQCPACAAVLHVCGQQNQPLRATAVDAPPEPVREQVREPVQFPVQPPPFEESKGSRSVKDLSSKGPEVNARAKTLDELLAALHDKKPRLKPAPYQQLELAYTFSDEERARVEYVVRLCGEKWGDRLGTGWKFNEVPVDYEVVTGILQAGPVEAIEGEALKGAAREVALKDMNVPQLYNGIRGVQTYFRTLIWDRLRGVKWTDLPVYWKADRHRMPPRRENGGMDIAAMANAKSF